MSYITTFSKIHFSPATPVAEDIKIEDIAHALSLLCRGNGHVKHFYSVAQHSINCAREAAARGCPDKVRLACLLHDASEAYLSDITRPVKAVLDEYKRIEARLQTMIYQKFIDDILTDDEKRQVKSVDDAMLYWEMADLLDEALFPEPPELMSTPHFGTEPFSETERRFLSMFNQLSGLSAHDIFSSGENFLSVGIDGCKGGWIAVAIHKCGFEISKHGTIADACRKYGNADSIIVDMPIGLAEEKPDNRPDDRLRSCLKGKASSVFPTPCRQAVYAPDYSEAIAENKRCLGKSIPPLSYAIVPKIREIDCFLQSNPDWKNRLVESHPEYCFAVMNGGIPILLNKQTLEGANARLGVIGKYYGACYPVLNDFKKKHGKKTDDLIDALCLAVTGALGLRYGFTTLPTLPPKDSRGILMQITGAKLPTL